MSGEQFVPRHLRPAPRRETIYQCLTKSGTFIRDFPTQRQAIDWLERNGGGIYRNILHRFNCQVDAAIDAAREGK